MDTKLDLTSDNKIAVDSGKSSVTRIYDFKLIQNKPTDILKGHSDWVRGLLLSEDKKILFSCSEDKTIKMWSLDHEFGKCLKTFERH